MADFPANGRRSVDGAEVALGCFVILIGVAVIITALVAVGFMIHGVVVRDIWQVVGGAVTLVVLGIIRLINRAILS